MTVPAGVGIDGFAVAGNLLLTADGSNLFVYNIGQAVATPVTAQVTIPTGDGVSIVPGSFNIAPTNTVTGTDTETLEWDFAFASGNTSETITWQRSRDRAGGRPVASRGEWGNGPVRHVAATGEHARHRSRSQQQPPDLLQRGGLPARRHDVERGGYSVHAGRLPRGGNGRRADGSSLAGDAQRD